MTKHTDIPQFGTLSGVRVVSAGIAIAGPFAATLMAEQGADVIWVENALVPSAGRSPMTYSHNQDRRNERFLALNIPSPEGREVFLRLMKETDILVENYRGGQLNSWNLTDEVLWEANPKLVIAHVSGFGQTGLPEYVERPSWDGIGQAFSGFMYLTGNPEPEPPMRIPANNCDYITALNACWASIASLRNAEKTGKGESIDIAQYEVMLRTQSDFPMKYLETGRQAERNGNHDSFICGYYPFKCKDGKYMFVAPVGATAMKGLMPKLGFQWPSEEFPPIHIVVQGTPGSKKFFPALAEFCESRTSEELEKELLALGVPCSPVLSYADAVNHPHYQARGVFMEWEDLERKKTVKGVSPAPRFKNHPSQIWRGCAAFGADNEDILGELGFQEEEIQKLYAGKVVARQ